jgi:hypothetical protein
MSPTKVAALSTDLACGNTGAPTSIWSPRSVIMYVSPVVVP